MRLVPLVILSILCCPAGATVEPGTEAQYFVQSAAEHQTPPVRRVRIVAGDVEKAERSVTSQWWEMTLEKQDGSVLGVKALSTDIPMTQPRIHASGGVASAPWLRYIYSPSPGICLEYTDEETGRCALPLTEHWGAFVPLTSPAARFDGGFATTGELLGHVLVRSNNRPDFPKVDFSNPKVLRLRTDLLIGSHIDTRDDRDESIPLDERKDSPLTREEYMELIEAGANYFHPRDEAENWIRDLPVFYSTTGVFPDDFYRSNFVPNRMFIDEPTTRFGWNEWVPSSIMGPEIAAQAIMSRIFEAHEAFARVFRGGDAFNTGSLDFRYNRAPSWDTQQFTAFYQVLAGAPGLIFEGRYNKRGYGWNPEAALGEGLEGLTDKQQFDYFHAFCRGAAAVRGYWGTSVYPEGDKSMMIPALCRAYDQGAKCLWFWNDRNLPYKWRLHVLKALNKHIMTNPRTVESTVAKTAIVLPKGYMLTPDSIWWMPREQLNPFGASYGDICAAATFEGILLSRAGVEYEYVNAEFDPNPPPRRQLIYVREDGRVEWDPPRKDVRAPRGLKLTVARKEGPGVASHAGEAAFTVPRAARIEIDGDLADWSSARWIEMLGEPYVFGDNYKLEIDLKVPEVIDQALGMAYLGFTWDQISPQYREKYRLEGYQDNQVVVTSVTPDSAAAAAGLREGDVILYMNDKWTRWAFEVWGIVDNHKKRPGDTIHLKLQRGGLDRYSGPGDLSARVALAVDDANLYVAADVADDVHQQNMPGPELWQNDSFQIGIDPVLARTDGYGEHGHEIGFALQDGKPIAYRWAGRRGQPLGIPRPFGVRGEAVRTAIRRIDGRTIYEAAIPLAQLAPLSPDMWPHAGLCFVVNDSDDGRARKARLELVTGAMTAGKRLDRFPEFSFAPSDDRDKLSSAIIWERRCAMPDGAFELTLAVCSPETRRARVRAKLESLDDPQTTPVEAAALIPVTSDAAEFVLKARTQSPPGRYRLTVEVLGPGGAVAASDALPVYVYK